MSWHDMQREFAERLRNPDAPAPAAITPTPGASSVRRFNVYRNNSTASLIDALGAAYPVVKRLVGDEFFAAMARVFVAQTVPKSPVILTYGEPFPEFVAGFEPAASVPYLADVARLECAWLSAYHAEDRDPVGIDQLARFNPDQLEDVRFVLHPSWRLVCSAWPVVSIWHAHQGGGDPAKAMQDLEPGGEQALIVRPQFDVEVRMIATQTVRFLDILHRGGTLGQAAETLPENGDTDMAGMLQLLFAVGGVAGVSRDNADQMDAQEMLEA